jgi:hypothetical protein
MDKQRDQRVEWWLKSQQHRTIKKPRRQRQMDDLRAAAARSENGLVSGIMLHREGGRGYGKDLRELVDRGLLKMVRKPYSKGWGGKYDLRVTILVITDDGRGAIERGKIV